VYPVTELVVITVSMLKLLVLRKRLILLLYDVITNRDFTIHVERAGIKLELNVHNIRLLFVWLGMSSERDIRLDSFDNVTDHKG